jgi:putative flavoprotein involved in K+ transport
MVTKPVDIIIIGAGQAGLVLSYCLTEQRRPHVVLEQGRIGESWRSRRWDSLRLVGPNWTMRFPGFAYTGDDPDGFMSKDEVVAHLEAYARSFGAPVREGVRVTAVEADPIGTGFVVQTEAETFAARQVVVATGALQRPWVPRCAAELPACIRQLVPYTYRNPQQLPPGAVLVVGSGQAGCQIAEELRRAGRPVYLSVGRSWWVPRRYRGRDISLWLRETGWFERTVDDLPPGVRIGLPNPQHAGSDDGHDLSLHTLAAAGVGLVGRLQDIREGVITVAPDLAEQLAWGEAQTVAFLGHVDRLVQERGWDVPAADPLIDPQSTLAPAQHAPTRLDLAAAGIGTVLWAVGYRPDLAWVRLPILDVDGYPIQRQGVTAAPGLFLLGLDWLHSAKSGLFVGIGEDAAYLAAHMARAAGD